jgi:hypothetical protein
MFMQMAVDIMQLFDSDGVVGVRREDDDFFRHDGLGLHPVRDDHRLRRERDDLFRSSGGIRLIKLSPTNASGSADYLSIDTIKRGRLGHVLLDQLSGFVIRSTVDWQIAKLLALSMVRKQSSVA